MESFPSNYIAIILLGTSPVPRERFQLSNARICKRDLVDWSWIPLPCWTSVQLVLFTSFHWMQLMQLLFDLGYGGSPSCDSLAVFVFGHRHKTRVPVSQLRFLLVFKVFPGRTVKQLKNKTLLNAPTAPRQHEHRNLVGSGNITTNPHPASWSVTLKSVS